MEIIGLLAEGYFDSLFNLAILARLSQFLCQGAEFPHPLKSLLEFRLFAALGLFV